MPEIDDLDDDLDESGTQPTAEDFQKLRHNARQKAKFERENAELKTRLAAMERKEAFTSAGLSLTDKQQAALLAAHGDTDLTADALKATAIELGFAQPPADDQQAVRDQAVADQQKIASAQAGGTPPPTVPDLNTQVVAAEQAGDWAKARQLKSDALVAAIFRAKT